jgi:homoserine acetyltransferase
MLKFSAMTRILSAVALIGSVMASAPAFAAATTSLADHAVLGKIQWLEGSYESPKRSAECLALQAKLVTKRTAIKTSSEWRDVSNSDAYKMFEESHESLKTASCHQATESTEKDACVALTEKVCTHAGALSESVQWKALSKSKSWNNLFIDFKKAEKLGCVKATHMPLGMK